MRNQQHSGKTHPREERQKLKALQQGQSELLSVPFSALSSVANHNHNTEKEDGGKQPSAAKRQRCLDHRDESDHEAKRHRRSLARPTESQIPPDKKTFIEDWSRETSWSRRSSAENQTQLSEASVDMPRKPYPVLPCLRDSSEGTVSTFRKFERSVASVHDPDYHQSLQHRNIFIEREDPPIELMRRAQQIVSCSRTSPGIDDANIQKLKDKSRRLRNEAKDVIIKQLASHLIPAMDEIPDRRLEMNADQPWFNSVPVPLDTSILANPLPLPKPKPDLAFGYSETAFTRNQLGTIDLLIDDQFGRSYAVPDQKLRFPFLDVEFKSQAKSGTHHMATNQAAGAGAIALNGQLELIQHNLALENFDYDEPQFFSVTMDHELARINVHWLKAHEGGQHSFHVERLSKHLLDDTNGVRSVIRAIKNILDYGVDARLRTLCKALDAYRETVIRNRETANAHNMQENEHLEERPTKRQFGKRVPPPERQRGSNQTTEEVAAPSKRTRHTTAKKAPPAAVTKFSKRTAPLDYEQETPSDRCRIRQTRHTAREATKKDTEQGTVNKGSENVALVRSSQESLNGLARTQRRSSGKNRRSRLTLREGS